MPGKQLHISPNKPLFVCLVDPQGDHYDFGVRAGQYETTSGDLVTLPRPAVVALFHSGAKPGEEIIITQHWDGLPGSDKEWTVALSTRSELARAEAGEPDSLTRQLEQSLSAIHKPQVPIEAPTPIRKPSRRESEQPKLFDRRGTGTHGPAPAEVPAPAAPPVPLPAVARYQKRGQIPANVAVREILAFINIDPNTKNWSDQARQDMASTVYIAHVKQGHIGLWERGE